MAEGHGSLRVTPYKFGRAGAGADGGGCIAMTNIPPVVTVLGRLASYLSAKQPIITDLWLQAVRRDDDVDSAIRLTHDQLIDHLPSLYASLCEFLRERDPELLQEEVKRDAHKHGVHRWRNGYHLAELLREIDILRRILLATTLTQFGETDPQFRGTIEITARTLVQEFFSEVTMNSAEQFMEEQQAATNRYIAELERTNRGLERAVSQRQRLTSVLAHELRNFVQSLSYAAQLWESDPNNQQARIAAQSQIRDMHDLLQLLLEHSTVIGAAQPLTIETFDAHELCQELLLTYHGAAEAKGLTLIAALQVDSCVVTGDRLKTKQIIANLVSNAIKYTPSGNVTVRLTTSNADRWAVIVSDTGPGITDQAGSRLQDGLGTDDEALPGRGLGLGIVKDLVDLLGGSIHMMSTIGKGTSFEVLLPRTLS
jgi:signal transduction histidine kinase